MCQECLRRVPFLASDTWFSLLSLGYRPQHMRAVYLLVDQHTFFKSLDLKAARTARTSRMIGTPMHRREVSLLLPTLRVAALSLLTVICAAGCEKPIMTPNEPRSQFDRFDAIRDQRAPGQVLDEYGYSRPNIRQRLLMAE